MVLILPVEVLFRAFLSFPVVASVAEGWDEKVLDLLVSVGVVSTLFIPLSLSLWTVVALEVAVGA